MANRYRLAPEVRDYRERGETMSEQRIDLLDHGFVRLVDSMGSDLSIARAARVSYDAAWRAGEDEGSDAKLIRYLWKHKHTTPFEAVTLTFEVKAPIFVFRQWHRHRTQSYNELSARYKPLPEEFYLPSVEIVGMQSSSSKQGREFQAIVDESGRLLEIAKVQKHCENAFGLYRELLESGWPKELARACLPVNTYSHMFTTMNLLNFFRFATLRCDTHAQHEIRVYADAMMSLTESVVPVAVGAWRADNG